MKRRKIVQALKWSGCNLKLRLFSGSRVFCKEVKGHFYSAFSPPAGNDPSGKPVFLKDIWPHRADIQAVEQRFVIPAMFREVYSKITEGNEAWNSLHAPDSLLYPWDESSTYIKSPPFLTDMVMAWTFSLLFFLFPSSQNLTSHIRGIFSLPPFHCLTLCLSVFLSF